MSQHPANTDGTPCVCAACLYQPRPGRTYEPRPTPQEADTK